MDNIPFKNMKIAYYLRHNILVDDGVTKKVNTQIQFWRKNGHDVKVFCYVPQKDVSETKFMQYTFDKSYAARFYKDKVLLSDLNDYSPDIVYMRHEVWSKTVNSILSKFPTVVELNSNLLLERKLMFQTERSVASFFRYISVILLNYPVINSAAGIVGVTNEIVNLPENIQKKQNSIAIPNSIDFDYFPVIKKTGLKERIGLFFIGSPNQPWHGVDIIDKWAGLMPEYDFHVVGIEQENTNNLFFYGFLNKSDYIPILEKCSLCIGTLALYRNNMNEGCPLKVREYLACGFPVILGYNDSCFENSEKLPSWILHVDNKISTEQIHQFIQKNKNFVVDHELTWTLISAEYIEQKRLTYISEIYDENA